MKWTQKLAAKMQAFYAGRTGVDHLGATVMYTGLGLLIVSALTGARWLMIPALACYVYSVWRSMSKQRYRRGYENQKFLKAVSKITTPVKQGITRFKNRKVYKYVRCSSCKELLRVKRGCGSVTIGCPKCKNRFDVKA